MIFITKRYLSGIKKEDQKRRKNQRKLETTQEPNEGSRWRNHAKGKRKEGMPSPTKPLKASKGEETRKRSERPIERHFGELEHK